MFAFTDGWRDPAQHVVVLHGPCVEARRLVVPGLGRWCGRESVEEKGEYLTASLYENVQLAHNLLYFIA